MATGPRHVRGMGLCESSVSLANIGELVKPGTKKWKWETGDEKMGIFLHNYIACSLCIQQHLLEQTSATGDSREEVEHMHQLNTQKSIIDRPECCGCVTSHRTGRAELVYGLDKLVEQLF